MKKNEVQEYLKNISENYFKALGSTSGSRSEKSQTTPVKENTNRTAFIISPHPDDEAINGGLALRLQNELGFQIINIPYGLGSNLERQKSRLEELKKSCEELNFTVTTPLTPGLEENEILALLEKHKPHVVMTYHDKDHHKTHEDCSRTVQSALQKNNFTGKVVFHEFWQAQTAPNLLLELSETTVCSMICALLHHTGEIKRNPYHLRLPFTLGDNSRRGSELIGGVEKASETLLFSTLLTVGSITKSGFVPDSRKQIISQNNSLSLSFGN